MLNLWQFKNPVNNISTRSNLYCIFIYNNDTDPLYLYLLMTLTYFLNFLYLGFSANIYTDNNIQYLQ